MNPIKDVCNDIERAGIAILALIMVVFWIVAACALVAIPIAIIARIVKYLL